MDDESRPKIELLLLLYKKMKKLKKVGAKRNLKLEIFAPCHCLKVY